MQRTMMLLTLGTASVMSVATCAAARSAERRLGSTDMMQIPAGTAIHNPSDEPRGALPLGMPSNWATDTDYPTSAMREGRSDVTSFKLHISASGTITDCKVTRTSGSPDLDEATCNIMRRRARFKPAFGKDGKPVDGEFSNSMRWQIPKDGVDFADHPVQNSRFPPGYFLTH